MLVSSTVFANHKGGCGKSVLLFQSAAEYALAHPDQHVLVVDMTVVGDLTRLFLGGDSFERSSSVSLSDFVAVHGGTTKLLFDCLAFELGFQSGALRETATTASGSSGSGPLSFVSRLRQTFGGGTGSEDKSAGGSGGAYRFPVEKYLLRVADVNTHIPANIYLSMSSGGGSQHPFRLTERLTVVQGLRRAFQQAPASYKVLFDTDGDLHFSDYTRIAIGVADHLVVPLFPSFTDFHRVETFMEELFQMRQNGETDAKVQLMVWNNVDVHYNRPWLPVSRNVTPTKAAQTVIEKLNSLLAGVAAQYSTLFVQPIPDNASPVEASEHFSETSSMIMRTFGVTGMASADLGIPFACMQPGTLTGGAVEYHVSAEMLELLRANVRELADVL
jgi:cellulose biosynthesis protein BcsQ